MPLLLVAHTQQTCYVITLYNALDLCLSLRSIAKTLFALKTYIERLDSRKCLLKTRIQGLLGGVGMLQRTDHELTFVPDNRILLRLRVVDLEVFAFEALGNRLGVCLGIGPGNGPDRDLVLPKRSKKSLEIPLVLG